MFPFYNPWKHQKTWFSGDFRGYKIGTLAKNELYSVTQFLKGKWLIAEKCIRSMCRLRLYIMENYTLQLLPLFVNSRVVAFEKFFIG